MQLVMLAPASNLVTSVTAALMPTLLGPAASMTANKTDQMNQPSRKLRVVDETKTNNRILPAEKSVKMKKLTWQSSVTSGNKTESSIAETRPSASFSTTSKRPPILKETQKTPNPKIEITPEITEGSGKLNVNAENSEKASKENDLLLHTILNHIAYVNRNSGSAGSGFIHCAQDATPNSRKRQVRSVIKITYATAVLGFILTIAEFFQRFGPYGLMKYFMSTEEIQPWPWFIFQTFCRSCEILMGSAIANITKQPATNVHRYYKHNPAVIQRGSMFM